MLVEGSRGDLVVLPRGAGKVLVAVLPGGAVLAQPHLSLDPLPEDLGQLSWDQERELLQRLQGWLHAQGAAPATPPLQEDLRLMLRRLRLACAGAPAPEVSELVHHFALALTGTPQLGLLGVGHWGAVYELPGGQVLKLTQDHEEARAASTLVGRHGARHLPDFSAAVQLELMGRPLPFWALVREEVDQAGSLRGEEAELADLVYLLARGLPTGDHPAHLLERAQAEARGLSQELEAAGLDVQDLHPGNLGLRGGHLCLFDLSLARLQEEAQLPLLALESTRP